MKKVFKHQIQIPFHLCDPAGILFYGNFFGLAHSTYELWITKEAGSWDKWFSNGEWIAPIKSTHAEYFKPLPAGTMTNVEIILKSVTESSFTIVTEFTVGEVTHACIETVQVFCDKKSFTKISVPKNVSTFIRL